MQPIRVWGLKSAPDGALELHLVLPQTLDLNSSGKLKSDAVTLQSDLADRAFLTATLHHGTEQQFQEMLAHTEVRKDK